MEYKTSKHVYFIQGKLTGLIKIGQSEAPETRMEGLQTGSPDILVLLGSVPCTDFKEGEIHRTFGAFKAHGEWFKPVPELLDFIARNATR